MYFTHKLLKKDPFLIFLFTTVIHPGSLSAFEKISLFSPFPGSFFSPLRGSSGARFFFFFCGLVAHATFLTLLLTTTDYFFRILRGSSNRFFIENLDQQPTWWISLLLGDTFGSGFTGLGCSNCSFSASLLSLSHSTPPRCYSVAQHQDWNHPYFLPPFRVKIATVLLLTILHHR